MESAVYVVQVHRTRAGVRVLARDPAAAAGEEFASAEALWRFLVAGADAQATLALLAALRVEVARHLEVMAARLDDELARDPAPSIPVSTRLSALRAQRAAMVRLLKRAAQPSVLGAFAETTLAADDELGQRLQQRVRELLRSDRPRG